MLIIVNFLESILSSTQLVFLESTKIKLLKCQIPDILLFIIEEDGSRSIVIMLDDY